MSQREAALNLEWAQWNNLEWGANLPPIPGYPGTRYDGNVYAVVGPSAINGDAYGFRLYISISYDDNIVLDNSDFDIPDGTADEMMAAVDNLSLRDIADMLDDMGYGPIDNRTASRKATRRVASLDLDWEETTSTFGEPLYTAVLPAIPGYPYSGDGNSTVTIGPDFTDSTGETYTWWMDIEVGKNDNKRFTDYELTGMSGEPLDYQMGYLDGLSVEWIADKLAEKGYMPEED